MNNKKKGLVSTLMCTYNAEKFIKGTLESVLEQTYNNQEILIWDDGSIDKTIEIIKKYIEKDYKIKIWTSKDEGKKIGPYGGLNFLIDKSKGEFIAIQDHDDIWHSEKIEKQVLFLNNNLDYIAVSTLRFIFDENYNVIYHDEQHKNSYYHTSLLYRNNKNKYNMLLEKHNDNDFKSKFLKKVHIIEEVLCLHRLRKGYNNLSLKWNNKDISLLAKINKFLYKRLFIIWLFKNFFFSSKKFVNRKNKKYIKLFRYLNIK